MRKRQTRAEQRDATRAAILDAAAELFLKQGIAATSLDAVAAKLGLTKGAVYANFASKAELVNAVGAMAGSGNAEVIAGLIRTDRSLKQRLAQFARSLVHSRFTKDLVLLDLEFVIYAARTPSWARAAQRQRETSMQEFAAQFRAVNQAQGARLPIDELRFLELLLLVGRGIVQKRTVDPGSVTAADAEAMVGVLTAGSFKP